MPDNRPDARAGADDPSPPDGLWLALALDGAGGARVLARDDVALQTGPVWVHLDPRVLQVPVWIRERSGLSPAEAEMLLRDEFRPRMEMPRPDCFVISLRGLAPELGAAHRDLALIHMSIEPRRVISLSSEALPGVARLRELYRHGDGPHDIQDLVLWMAVHLETALRDQAFDLEDEITDAEYQVEEAPDEEPPRLRSLSIRTMRLRRHVTPFKILLSRLVEASDSWLLRDHRGRWRHLVDAALDTETLLRTLHERVRMLRDSVTQRLARRMNHVLYLLTVFSMILLPLTFITSIFGMNVGVSGASVTHMESLVALVVVCAVLILLGWVEYRLIKRRRLL